MSQLAVLETYYDAAPRPVATVEEVGPFSVFIPTHTDGWPFYARPALGYDGRFAVSDVHRVRERQRQLGVPESIEWVHETTPTLLRAARETGLHVAECPLLVLPAGAGTVVPPLPAGYRVAMLESDAPELPSVAAAVSAGFAGTDEVVDRQPGPLPELIRRRLTAMAGAYDARGAVGGGSHSPRGSTTELTGIAVLPRARRLGIGAAITQTLVVDARQRGVSTVFLSAQDDAVARVYERIGFERVGTACVAEAQERGSGPDTAGLLTADPTSGRVTSGDAVTTRAGTAQRRDS